MSFAHFVIFRQGKHARAARVLIPDGKQDPVAFRYEGRTYNRTPLELSNGDHLLDSDRELGGFSFLLGGDTEVGHSRLVKECDNVENESGIWLKFFLAGNHSHRNDNCQLIYPIVYADGQSDHMVLVQECPECWSALSFRLATHPLPEPIFADR